MKFWQSCLAGMICLFLGIAFGADHLPSQKNQSTKKLEFIVTNETSSLSAVAVYLYGHSRKHKDLASWNNISPPYNIRVGQKLLLKIPRSLSDEEGKIALRRAWRKKLGLKDSEELPPTIIAPVEPVVEMPIAKADQPINETPIIKMAPQVVKLKVGLSLTSLKYNRTGLTQLSSTLLNLNCSYRDTFSTEPWGWGADSLLTLLPINSNRTDTTIRFFRFSGHLSYALPWVSNPWNFSILGGVYYAGMFTTGKAVGYRDITGPLLSPVLSRKISNGDLVSAYLKVSPITNGMMLMPFSNKELLWGISWSHYLNNGHPLSIEFTKTNFELLLNRVLITDSAQSLGLSYWW